MGKLHNTKKRIENVEKRIDKAEDISTSNKSHIFDFKKKCIIQELSSERILFYLERLYKVGKWVDKDFKEMERDDIESLVADIQEMDNYSRRTKYDYKTAIKKFFQVLENYEWKSKKYPEKVDWMSLTRKRQYRKLPEEILSKEDVKKMVRNADRLRDKALVWTLYESGCRIGEFKLIKVKHVQFDDQGYILRVHGKTGSRRIRLIESERRMQNWLEDHPDSDNPEAYIWIGLEGGRKRKRLGAAAIRKLLRRIARRAEVPLNKVNPHNFRHSRATELAKKLTEAQMCEYFGWVQGSDQPATYVHLSGRDLDGAILEMHGMESKEEKENHEPQDCPRCGKQNAPRAKFCSRCSAPLDEESMMKVQKAEKITDRTVEARLERMEQKIQKLTQP